MSKEDGGPAFGYVARIRSETRWNTDPTGEFPAQNRGEEQIVEVVGGMTLRDYFATHAPAVPHWFRPSVEPAARFIEWRWCYAIMMLAERSK